MKKNESLQKQERPSQLPLYGFVIAISFLFIIVLAGLGSRWEWWGFRTGFSILEYGAYGGLGAALVSLIGLAMNSKHFHRQLFFMGISGLLLGLLTVGVPWSWWKFAKGVPPIHDITTDTRNPPVFESILPLRGDASNPVAYGGPEIAKLQKSAYPDIVPAILLVSKEEAFQRALVLAQAMGWKIVDADLNRGRIEATDTTFWFGFKDDIVIRISPHEEGTLVNLRSVSRVGRSDVGTNAMRIRKFLNQL
ncbi:MAG TPA: DUF1499 domain-containing protein [Nitrospiria bacterium]|jgi:uncharacterized protein (DUF1499 family)